MAKSGSIYSAALKFSAAFLMTALLAGSALAQATAPAAPAPIPRASDGHVSLNGLWAGGVGLPSGSDTMLFAGRGGTFEGMEEDGGLNRLATLNKPIYLPQWWETVKDNDYNGNWLDPRHKCMPEGVPRIGAPSQVIQVPDQNLIIFRYRTGFDGRTEARVIPTDGRPHNVANVAAETWYGDSVGHWEGDTLVIESIGFTDASWLHKSGYIHGFNMKVTEYLTRPTVNQLHWEATVEDSEYLAQPWKMDPVNRALNTDPTAVMGEDLPCYDFEPFYGSHTRSG